MFKFQLLKMCLGRDINPNASKYKPVSKNWRIGTNIFGCIHSFATPSL